MPDLPWGYLVALGLAVLSINALVIAIACTRVAGKADDQAEETAPKEMVDHRRKGWRIVR